MSKFSAEIPKGDGWGVESAVAEIVDKVLAGGKSPLIPCIAIIDVKAVAIDPESGNKTATVRVRRLEALTTAATIRDAQRMLMREWELRKGDAILPFDDKQIIDQAFSDIDLEAAERDAQDEREKLEDEGLAEYDRLRRHLVTVHKHDSVLMDSLEDTEARIQHDSDHNQYDADGVGLPEHERDWWAWRRVDIEAAESLTEDGDEDSQVNGLFDDPFTPPDETEGGQ